MSWPYNGSNPGGASLAKTFNWSVSSGALIQTLALTVDLSVEFGLEDIPTGINLYALYIESIVLNAPQPLSATVRSPTTFNSFYPAVEIYLTDGDGNISALIQQRFNGLFLPEVGFVQIENLGFGAGNVPAPNTNINQQCLGPMFATKVSVCAQRGAAGTLIMQGSAIAADGPGNSGGSVNYSTKGGMGPY